VIKYQKIRESLKSIHSCEDHKGFINLFLRSFEFPDATIKRLELNHNVNHSITYLKNKVLFISTDKLALNVEMDRKKSDYINDFNMRFILFFNKNDIFSFDTKTNESLKTSKKDFYNYFDFFLPLLGQEKIELENSTSVNIQTAKKIASLYNELVLHPDFYKQFSVKDLNLTIARLLFCFWIDSFNLFGKKNLVQLLSYHTFDNGENTHTVIEDIFNALGSNSSQVLSQKILDLPQINTDLFNNQVSVPIFSKKARKQLIELSALNWSEIDSDLLGLVIESVTDPEDLSGLNNNYTSSANVVKVIGPLFLNDLYEEFERAQKNLNSLINLHEKVVSLRVFDPSCGAGNFLIVSLVELRALESEIRKKILSFSFNCDSLKNPSVSQFYGIESNHFKVQISRLGLCFMYFQGNDNSSISIDSITRIYNSTKILLGNPTRIDWRSFCSPDSKYQVFIVTNPTYKGARKQTSDQKKDIQFVFKDYKGVKNLDYSSCWLYLSSKYIENANSKAAIVTTNSLTQGEQVGLLWPKIYLHNVEIYFAHTSFKWKTSYQAKTGVTVVIIGLSSLNTIPNKTLYTVNDSFVSNVISPYLTIGTNVIVNKRNKPISNFPSMPKGNMPYDNGHLILSTDEKNKLVNDYPTSNKYIKKLYGSNEFIKKSERWCIWIEDDDLSEAKQIEPINIRINNVYKFRINSKDSSARKLASRSHQFRETNTTSKQTIIVPSVSSEKRNYIPIGFLDSSCIITNLAFAIYDCESWIFGVLTSHMHNLWIRAVCGSLETRIRYSSSLGYNTFPFPYIDSEKRNAIKVCTFDILEEREKYSEKNFSELYNLNTMPEGLKTCHKTLDMLIDQCYREECFYSDEERLNFLFQLYKKENEKSN
jgi:hypothetical protein